MNGVVRVFGVVAKKRDEAIHQPWDVGKPEVVQTLLGGRLVVGVMRANLWQRERGRRRRCEMEGGSGV